MDGNGVSAKGRNNKNSSSLLLTPDENELLFSLLGKRCFTLASAVVQLLTTDPPIHSQWTKRVTGVVCFVRDCTRRSYFITVYDIDNRKCVWQQEMYSTFEYRTPREYFHTFEAEDCMAGLNFANEREAEFFKDAVNQKLRDFERRKSENRQKKNQQSGPLQPIQSSNIQSQYAGPPITQTSIFPKYKKKTKGDKKKKNKLRKEDIGNPTDFTHITHIGWDPKTGFDMNNAYGELSEFLKMAGVDEDQMKDADTATFVYDYLEKHGGVDAAIEEARRAKQRQPTPLAPPHHPPPLPPSRVPHKPPPHKTSLPAPPPPPPPPPPPASFPTSAAPPPPPPPPPPPMMSSTNPLPPTNGNAKPLSPPKDSRSLLLEQIRQGARLNHVDPETDSIKSDSSSNGGGRDALMHEIRQGVQLKSVEINAERNQRAPPPEGLAGALAKALEARQRAIQQTDESSSESESEIDDDEWND